MAKRKKVSTRKKQPDVVVAHRKDPKSFNFTKTVTKKNERELEKKRKKNLIDHDDDVHYDNNENNDNNDNNEYNDYRSVDDNIEETYSDDEQELEDQEEARLEAEKELREIEEEELNHEDVDHMEDMNDIGDDDFDMLPEDTDGEDYLYYGAANAFNDIQVVCSDSVAHIKTKMGTIFNPQSGLQLTTEEFCEDMLRWKGLQNMSDSGTLSLFVLLKKFFPAAELPIKETKAGQYVLNTTLFTSKNPRSFEMHVCRDGCMSFINKSEKFLKCDICGKDRFRPCRQHNCTNPNCDPFSGSLGNHSLAGRKSKRLVHYDPVIPLFKELTQRCLEKLKGGEGYNVNPSNNIDVEVGKEYTDDIKNSVQSKLHLGIMHSNFDTFVNEQRVKGDETVYIESSFIYSVSYDGGTLFKRGSKAVWPLIITMLNCNPSLRNIPGIGAFLVAFHDLVPGCDAEQSLYLDLFIPELNLLSKGIPFTYVGENGTVVNVFLQARLVCHTYDTPAGQKVFYMQGVGSLAGCLLCNSMRGLGRMNTLDKIINMGHRGMLPNWHILRYFGMSMQCCPRGYYDGTEEEMKKVRLDVEALFNKTTAASIEASNLPKNIRPKPVTKRTNACDDVDCAEGAGENCGVEMKTTLFNKKYNINSFRAYLFYAHCDFKKSKDYSRRKNKFYTDNGNKFNTWRQQILDHFTRRNEEKPLANRKSKLDILKSVKNQLKNSEVVDKCFGMKGESAYSKLRHYGDSGGIENSFAYDFFHSAMNFNDCTIKVTKGEKGASEKSIIQSHCERRFCFQVVAKKKNDAKPTEEQPKKPLTKKQQLQADRAAAKLASDMANPRKAKKNQYTNYTNDYCGQIKNRRNIPWLLSLREQNMVDWKHICIIIPIGLKDSYSFKFMYKHTGYLKGNDKIKWLSVFINFDLSTTSLPQEYKNLFRLVSELIADILSPVVDDTYIAELFMRTVEALCLWEGMFPDSEQYFSVHELLDIVDGMYKFGPVRGWWTLAGERIMGKLKSYCPQGGLNCVKVIYERFKNYENNMKYCQNFGRNHSNLLDNFGDYSDIYTNKLVGKQYALSNKLWNTNNWLMANFTEYLYIYLQSTEIDDLLFFSPFYRLYTTYEKTANKKKFLSFWLWIKSVHNSIATSSPTVQIVNRELNLDIATDRSYINIEIVQHRCSAEQPVRILARDVDTVREIVEFLPTFSVNGIVKGLFFHGRGPLYSELTAPNKYGVYKKDMEKLSLPNNLNNDLTQFWNHPKQSSTFMKFKNYFTVGKQIKFDLAYGQLNYISVLSLPSDKYLHNLPFANITARDTFIDECDLRYIKTRTTPVCDIAEADHKKIQIEINSNYNDQVQFVALNYIESTNVAICGLDSQDMPILTSDEGLTTSELFQSLQFCVRNTLAIEKLYLIDLHPNRRLIDISADKVLKSVIRSV